MTIGVADVATWLIPLIDNGPIVVLIIGCILMGYWMGRNSAERGFRSESAANESRPSSQGSHDEPEGDIFEDAMEIRELDQRVPTIIKGGRNAH